MSSRDDLIRSFERYYETLRSFVRRRVSSPETAADILQDCYLRVVQHGQTAAIRNPLAFFYRVASNLIIDRARENNVRERLADPDGLTPSIPDGAPHSEAVLIAHQRFEILVRAVEELPPRCREVFLLRKFEHLEMEEIATRLRITRNMVEKHLRRALLHCQLRLAEHD